MSEIKESTDKTLRGDVRKPLSLKRTVESGHVRQSFSHGRSKSVVVEKKKKRTITGPGGIDTDEAGDDAAVDVLQRQGGLSTDELDARRRAISAEKERAELQERERARLEALKPPPPEPEPEPEPAQTEPAPPAVEVPVDALAPALKADAEAPPATQADTKVRPPEKAKVGEVAKRP